MVFFMRYLARIRAARTALPSSSAFRSRRPWARAGSRWRKAWSASAAAVSMTVPEGRVKVRDSRVW